MNESKGNIEQLILQDIDYILNYKPVAKGAESAKYFSKMTIIKPIALNVYPQIYIDLVKRFEKNEAIHRLRNLGLRVAKFYYSSFPEVLKKPQKLTEILEDVAKTHLHEKMVFKDEVLEGKRLKSCKIEVRDCFFCSEVTLIENTAIPYCTALSGLYQNLYNIRSLYSKNLEPRLIHVDTLKSAQFDGDTCEYQLTVIE
jgi:predicted hydrocarbon binding protein